MRWRLAGRGTGQRVAMMALANDERAVRALSQRTEHAMDRDVTKNRLRAEMEAEFLPDPSPDTLNQGDRRMANAAEYVAYHLWSDRQ